MATTKLKIETELIRRLFLNQPSIKDLYWEFDRKITYNDFLSNKMLIILAIRAGIPYSLFKLIQNYTPFTEKMIGHGFSTYSTKSLHRYKTAAEHSFKPIHSEKKLKWQK
ncbi:MAG: hypothetical protein IPN88_19400 [Bacteroidetes bacterium]|nr:hypothetical protein [Bacteroidota bacterium]